MKTFFYSIIMLSCFFTSCITQLGNEEVIAGRGSIVIREKNRLNPIVFIDGKKVLRESFDTINNILIGTRQINFYLPDYKPVKDSLLVDIYEGKYTEVELELVKNTGGSLVIQTTPSGMIVSINGLEFGVSPFTVKGLPPGDYTITTEYTNFHSSKTIAIKANSQKYDTLKGILKRSSTLEYFSNTDCAGCPVMGGALFEYLHNNPDIHKYIDFIAYHAHYPSANDPFYVVCKNDQKTRHDFYFPDFLPQAYFNGKLLDWNEKKNLLDSLITTNFYNSQTDTPFTAGMFFSNVIQSANEISGMLNIIPNKYSAIKISNLSLKIALVDDFVNFHSAPGTNGQKEFHSIFRGFFTQGNQTQLPEEDTIRISFSMNISRFWSEDLRIVSFLQHNTQSKTVRQSVHYKLF